MFTATWNQNKEILPTYIQIKRLQSSLIVKINKGMDWREDFFCFFFSESLRVPE